jgi:hypothetical protein
MPYNFMFRWFIQFREGIVRPWSKCESHARDVFEKLRLPLEPTGMCLELGDNPIRYPLGIAEDVPVKVG